MTEKLQLDLINVYWLITYLHKKTGVAHKPSRGVQNKNKRLSWTASGL